MRNEYVEEEEAKGRTIYYRTEDQFLLVIQCSPVGAGSPVETGFFQIHHYNSKRLWNMKKTQIMELCSSLENTDDKKLSNLKTICVTQLPVLSSSLKIIEAI